MVNIYIAQVDQDKMVEHVPEDVIHRGHRGIGKPEGHRYSKCPTGVLTSTFKADKRSFKADKISERGVTVLYFNLKDPGHQQDVDVFLYRMAFRLTGSKGGPSEEPFLGEGLWHSCKAY